MSTRRTEVQVGNRKLSFSNLEKVFYPKTGFTKGEVIDYYRRIAPAMLPHLKDRPLTLKRYPNGVEGEFFYEKQCPAHRPDWVRTAPVWSEFKHRNIDFCIVNDMATLVWAANLAVLEMHTSLSLAKDVMRPTILAFDLDPGAPADIINCCEVGLWLREYFDELGMQTFPKTSGSKGLQVYIPLNTPTSYEQTKPFAHAMAQMLEKQYPKKVISLMKKDLRKGKVFVDWSQNDDHKTTVCVYSLRAKDRPTVSTPVTWQEVERAFKKEDASLLTFDFQQVLDRIEKHGDLFAPVLKLKQKLPQFEAAMA